MVVVGRRFGWITMDRRWTEDIVNLLGKWAPRPLKDRRGDLDGVVSVA